MGTEGVLESFENSQNAGAFIYSIFRTLRLD